MNIKNLSKKIEIEDIIPKISSEQIKICTISFPEFREIVTRKDLYCSNLLLFLLGISFILGSILLIISCFENQFKSIFEWILITITPFIAVFGVGEIQFLFNNIHKFIFYKNKMIMKFQITEDFLNNFENIIKLFNIKNLIIYSYIDQKYFSIIKNFKINEKNLNYIYTYKSNYDYDKAFGITLEGKISENKEIIKEILNIFKNNKEYLIEKERIKS